MSGAGYGARKVGIGWRDFWCSTPLPPSRELGRLRSRKEFQAPHSRRKTTKLPSQDQTFAWIVRSPARASEQAGQVDKMTWVTSSRTLVLFTCLDWRDSARLPAASPNSPQLSHKLFLSFDCFHSESSSPLPPFSVGIMLYEEPTLPPLKAVSWDEDSQSIANPRKRVRVPRIHGATNSSDPAVFSSDDDPDVSKYVEGRRKKQYVGTWFDHNPASSDSQFAETGWENGAPAAVGSKPTRTFERNIDSGVFLGSDGTESDAFDVDLLDIMKRPKLPLRTNRVVASISEAEGALRKKINKCIESSEETIDAWGMGLDQLSSDTIAPMVASVTTCFTMSPLLYTSMVGQFRSG
jgi:hypothetical protein